MKVWLVYHWDRHEGSTVIAVEDRADKAEAKARDFLVKTRILNSKDEGVGIDVWEVGEGIESEMDVEFSYGLEKFEVKVRNEAVILAIERARLDKKMD